MENFRVKWPICLAVLIFSCSKKQENKSAQDQKIENRTVATIPSDTRIPTKINGKWGYTNANGDTAISAYFDEAQEFLGGLARVKLGDKWTFITSDGKIIISPQFDEAGDFHNGVARVKLGDKWGCIERTGKFVRNLQSNGIVDCSEGLSRVDIFFGGRHIRNSFVDTVGTIALFASLFDGRFPARLIPVRINNQWGYADTTGKIIIKPQFDQGGDFSEELAPVLSNDSWGYVDTTGKIVIKPQYYGAGDFSGGLAPVLIDLDSPIKYIDTTGKIVATWKVDTVISTQNDAESGTDDELNVLARSGLELKEAPSVEAKTLGVVPYGEKVVVIEDNREKTAFEIEGMAGHWILAKHGNETGYIFDGFLSKLPAPPEDCGSLEAYVNAMLAGVGKREIMYTSDYESEAQKCKNFEAQNCKYGAVLKIWRLEGGEEILTIPNIRLEEGFLIAKLCYDKDKNVARAVFPKGAEKIIIIFEEGVAGTETLTIEKTKDGNVRIKYYSSGC